MSLTKGQASYKKQDGTIALSDDSKSLKWSPSVSSKSVAALHIAVSSITNLQQTPVSNPKVMLRVYTQLPGQSEQSTLVFNFTSQSVARKEADAIKDALTKAIQASKLENADLTNAPSAAMAIASAISGGKKDGSLWDDDERLRSDVPLQQSLFKADPGLQKIFMESLRTKPESISTIAFTSQFWAARVHLLRAHAIEKNQNRGSYNVLSVLKPTTEDNQKKLNISREQIQLVFTQHPLVKKVYDMEVPKPLREEDFWSRFFQSRLLKKLRGEKIDPSDPQDKYLDKYLNESEFTGASRAEVAQVPRIIDLEGNEENHSQRKGNLPDFTQRPKRGVPIIRSINDLSEKIMARVAPSDIDPSQPIGMDEVTYNNLRLRDLQGDPEQNRVILKVRDQSHFFSDSLGSKDVQTMKRNKKKDPNLTIQGLVSSLEKRFPIPGEGVLQPTLGDMGTEDSDEDEEGDGNKASAAESQATDQIFDLIKQNHSQTEETSSTAGLSSDTYERLLLTHATTIEFQRQFWSAFLSSDPARASEIASLVESLNRAKERIKAVADDAEAERQAKITIAKKQARAVFEKTGKKPRIDYNAIGGGREVVEQMLRPVLKSLTRATDVYEKALKEQMEEDE
ncbi:MAG: hypothetical protein Q9160_004872 [Pyrenula sp. 1 TL-2023]